jgi:hypothetical protein
MWNQNPVQTGPVIRWGFSAGTNTLNPYLATGQQEGYVLGEVYDTLLRVNPYNTSQVIGWMANAYTNVTSASDPGCPAVASGGCLKLSLRGDVFFHDGVQLTASDLKFSILSLAANIVSVGSCLAANGVFDVSFNPLVLVQAPDQPEIVYVEFSIAHGLAALSCLANVPVLPQHVWAASTNGQCTSTGSLQCSVNPSLLSGLGADPVANNRLMGSGPFVCAPSAYTGPNMAGLGGGCTSTGTGSVSSGGTITLQRYGSGLDHLAGSYFRSNAKYKEFLWADTQGTAGQVDILDVEAILSCTTPTPNSQCSHYSNPDSTIACTGAGACIGTISGGSGVVTGLQKAEVLQWYTTSWNSPIPYGSLTGVLPASPAPPELEEDGSVYS